MRRALIILLAISMCFLLFACSKSEAVTNVETLIDSIGKVRLESDAVISSAEEAFNALSPKEQKKVDNISLLISARDELTELQFQKHKEKEATFVGKWVSEFYGTLRAELFSDNTLVIDGMEGTWQLNTAGTALQFTYDKYNYELKILEENEYIKLLADHCWVLEENYQEAFAQKFVAIELTDENFREYIGDYMYLGSAVEEDGFITTAYMIRSEAYDDGLVYLSCTENMEIEIIHYSENGTQTPNSQMIPGFPFYIIGSSQLSDEGDYSISIGSRASGTLYFVRKEYVKENFVDEQNINTVHLIDGSTYYDTLYFDTLNTRFVPGNNMWYSSVDINFSEYIR